MTFKENDFVKVDFDIYANDKLVQTTSEATAKKAGLKLEKFGATTLILGKAFILKALDDAILKNDSGKLELTADEAYGRRKKEFLKTFPKSAFDEQKMRPVVGVTYDFNGMFGTVKSVVSSRVMVDFNNPLAGRDIKIEYKVLGEVKDIAEKVSFVIESALKIPIGMFKVSSSGKEVSLEVPAQLVAMKEMFEKSLIEMIPELMDYSLKVTEFVVKKK